MSVTYRVRMRTKTGTKIISDDVTLQEAYNIVAAKGSGTNRQFAIDELVYRPYSVLTAREAKLRLQRGEV